MAERQTQKTPREDKGEASGFPLDPLQQAGEVMATPAVDKGEASSSSLEIQKAGDQVTTMRYMGRELLTENFELVLASLPYHVLCQFQLVSKGWQRLISQPHQKRLTLRPEIASLRTDLGRRTPYILITPKVVPCDPSEDPALHLDKRRDWHLLDVAEEKYYTLNDSLVNIFHRQQPFENLGWTRFTMAADEDLIYAVYISSSTGDERHVVCNPVTQSYHEINEPDMDFSEDNIVVMSVEKSTNRYKIVIVEAYAIAKEEPEGVFVYDSAFESKEWTYTCYVAGQTELRGKQMWTYSCVFFEQTFYTLFADLSMVPWCPKLYTCDLTTGVWSHINVDLPKPSHPQDKSQLVVCLSRLFFVEHTGLLQEYGTLWENTLDYTDKQQIDVTISELLLHNLVQDEMVKNVATKLNFATYPGLMYDCSEDVIGEPLMALGCGNSIVISTSFAHHAISTSFAHQAAWDLIEKCWHNLPANPQYLDMLPQEDERQGFCGSILYF